MLRVFSFSKLPAGLNINRMPYSTEAKLKALVFFNFGEELKDLEIGLDYVIADVYEDCVSGDDVFTVVKDSVKAIACVYSLPDYLKPRVMDEEEALLHNEKFKETMSDRRGENILQKSSELIAPVAVMFKMPKLPAGFSGKLHEFGYNADMCQAISNDFSEVKIIPDIIEPEMYYICAILCEDFEGPITYTYFIRCLRYDKLTAYKSHGYYKTKRWY